MTRLFTYPAAKQIERQIRVTKISGGVVELYKLSSNLITMVQNLVTVFHTVCTHVDDPKRMLARWYPTH